MPEPCGFCGRTDGRIQHADIAWPKADGERLKLPLRAHYGGLPAYQWAGWLHPACEPHMIAKLESQQ